MDRGIRMKKAVVENFHMLSYLQLVLDFEPDLMVLLGTSETNQQSFNKIFIRQRNLGQQATTMLPRGQLMQRRIHQHSFRKIHDDRPQEPCSGLRSQEKKNLNQKFIVKVTKLNLRYESEAYMTQFLQS